MTFCYWLAIEHLGDETGDSRAFAACQSDVREKFVALELLNHRGDAVVTPNSQVVALRNIVRESNDPLPALTRLAEINDVESIRSLLHTMHSQVAGPVWVAGVRPLPSAPRRALLLVVLLFCKAKPHLRMLVQDELEDMDRTTLAQSAAR